MSVTNSKALKATLVTVKILFAFSCTFFFPCNDYVFLARGGSVRFVDSEIGKNLDLNLNIQTFYLKHNEIMMKNCAFPLKQIIFFVVHFESGT